MNVEYVEIESEDYGGEIKRVVKEALGETYSNNVVSLEKDDNVLIVARVDGKPVGFACGYNSETPEDYLDYFDEDVEAKSILEKNAVLPEFRNNGIGTQLTRERLNRLEQPTLAESWARTKGHDSSGVLEWFGFEEIDTYEGRWYEESVEAQDEEFCPDCGRICHCDAIVYCLRTHPLQEADEVSNT